MVRRVVVVVVIVAIVIAMTLLPDRSGLAPAPPEPTTVSGAPPTAAEVAVVEVIDGDSAVLRIDGVDTEVRLRGINAPERFDCGGAEARAALTRALSGDVAVVGDEVDRFGRLLVDLRGGTVDINGYLVDQGWALAYHADGRYVARMRAASLGAETGWWGLDCDPTFDGVFVLGDVEPDPPGRDVENLDGEFVVIVNPAGDSASLGEWVLRDETTGHRFELPAIDVPAGGEVVVRTGVGADSVEEVFLGEERPVWSNGGETVLLLDPSGTIADVRFLS